MIFLLPLVIIALLAMPLYPVFKRRITGRSAKHAVVFNLCAFFGIMLLSVILPLGGFISAEGVDSAADAVAAASSADGMRYLAAALATGLSALGAGIAVASGASAAIGAVSEDDKNFAKALIFVALGEGVAIYGLLISILLLFVV